jgi:uncharacterized protein YggE
LIVLVREGATIMQRISLILALSGLCGEVSLAQTPTIQVSGVGRAEVTPNAAEITLTVSGSSELAEDAIKKYEQTLQQVTESFGKLDIANMKLEPLGFGVKQLGTGQDVVLNIQNQQGAKQPVTFMRNVRVSVSDIGKLPEKELRRVLGKLLDTAKDAGVAIQEKNQLARIWGEPTTNAIFFFVADGVDEAREEAYGQALVQAQQRASRLAKLARVELGGVHSIQESFTPPTDENSLQNRMIMAMYGMTQKEPDDDRVLSSEFKPVSVQVNLNVSFEIKK